jgi:TonB-linked SusC/RagA family outer membrane protein
MKKYLCVYVFLLIFEGWTTLPAQAQVKVAMTGQIISGRDNLPLPGATVKVAETGQSLVSDAAGHFTFFLKLDSVHLSVSYIGFRALRVAARRGATLQLRLEPDNTALQEVLVSTGYQVLPQERATGSFEQVDKELFNRSTGTDVLSRLDGVTTGTLFDKRQGADPLTSLTIRGIGSIYANTAPLIVVDNFPYEGDINNINPNDVASVTLLKDAAAASIWGVRAGNGVIVITTKRGLYNQPAQVSLSSNVTITGKPDLFYLPQMSSSDFIDVEQMLFSKGFYDSDLSNTFSRPPVSPVVNLLDEVRRGVLGSAQADAQINALRGQDVRNDFEKYIYRTGVNQQHALSLSGGSQVASYYFSVGYDKNVYNLVNSGYDRVTIKSSNTFRLAKGLELQAGLQYTSSNTSNENALSPYDYGAIIPAGKSGLYPYAQLADAKGNPLVIAKDYNVGFIDTTGAGKLLDWKYRPLQEAQLADNHTDAHDILVNLGLKYTLDRHFSAEIKYQYERSDGTDNDYYSPDSYYTRNLVNGYTQIGANGLVRPVPDGGILDLTENHLDAQDARAQLNYNTSWHDKNEVSAIAGTEIRQENTFYNTGRTYGYNPNLLTSTNVDEVTTFPYYEGLGFDNTIPSGVQFGNILNRYVSLYTNGSYTYDKRYLLSVSARKDESNLFGVSSNQKGVPLWSVGGGWNISNEKFYHWAGVPYLKFRLTYGYSGNVDNSLSAYTTIGYVSTNNYTHIPYANVVNPPNPDLQWEKVGMTNIGFDFSTKGGRLSGTVDYYRKQSRDLIGPAPVDPTTGFSYLVINSASLAGKGVDLQLNSRNLTGALGWNTALLFSYNRNIVSQYDQTFSTATAYVGTGLSLNPIVGRDVYALYSYRWAGLDPANGDPRGYVNGAVSKDYNTILNAPVSSLQYDGSAVPVYYGALRNTLTWKQFSLSANVQYKLGYVFRKTSINYTSLYSGWVGNSDYALRWQKPGDEKKTNVPSLDYPADANRDQFYTYSQATVGNADNIRLQDLRLSWQVDKKTRHGLPFKSLQVYAYASNLGILWRSNKWGIDPDYGQGIPAPRSLSLGFKADF